MKLQRLVIRGGTVADGTGAPLRECDVAIVGDRIVEMGLGLAQGDEEIDARDRIVMPGLIDPHTHYDAQVTWDHRLTPSTMNGVTTVLIGNCGVGFAPCAPADREMLAYVMEGVEDIPIDAMRAGLPWKWETFPAFMDFLDSRRYDADVAVQLPHTAVRLYVMGERALDGQPSTMDDRQAMRRIVAEGLRAGALGFSTSRSSGHRMPDGRPVPSFGVAADELVEIAHALRDEPGGWFQLITDFADPDAEMDMLERVARAGASPVLVSLLQKEARPEEWRHLVQRMTRATDAGARILPQVLPRATGVLMGFQLTEHPFTLNAAYRRIEDHPFTSRLATLRQPEFRAAVLAQHPVAQALEARRTTWSKLFRFGESPNYEPAADESIQAIANHSGLTPEAVAYDLMLERDGSGLLYRPISNFAAGNLDVVREMLLLPQAVVGLGDGGAHVGQVCDSNALVFLLTHWTRSRARGESLSLPWAVRRVTYDNARAMGMGDRGRVAPGLKADLNIIDYDRLQPQSPYVVHDLPGAQPRLVQGCHGICMTLLSGVVVQRDGRFTDALPGRLIRSVRSGPSC